MKLNDKMDRLREETREKSKAAELAIVDLVKAAERARKLTNLAVEAAEIAFESRKDLLTSSEKANVKAVRTAARSAFRAIRGVLNKSDKAMRSIKFSVEKANKPDSESF